jgi:hypothetical protein
MVLGKGMSAGILLLGLLAGCVSQAPTEPVTFGSDAEVQAFFGKAQSLEREGAYRKAIAMYARVEPARPGAKPSESLVRARYRMGRCREEMGQIIDARNHFAWVLMTPNLMASDGDIPLPGSLDIHFRKRAEKAMDRVGFDPLDFYLTIVNDRTSPLRLMAVKSLERVGDRRAILPLETLLTDETLKGAVVRTLGRIRLRIDQARKSGK